MKYTYSEIKNTLSKKKRKSESIWSQYVVRPLSFPLTYLLANLRMTAWAASVLSIVVAMAGCMMLCASTSWIRWAGVALINLWCVLDCVDGNIARVTKSASPLGEFIDAQSGYTVSAFCYIGMAMAAAHTSNVFGMDPIWMVFMGGMASVCNTLPRLIHQKYTVSAMKIDADAQKAEEEQEDERRFSFKNIRKRVGKEIGLEGMFMPLLILCEAFHIYHYAVIFYFAFTVVSLLLVSVVYAKKAKV